MAGSKIPGPLGSYPFNIDTGTLSRTNTPTPSCVGIEDTTVSAKHKGYKQCCPCTGKEKSHIIGLKDIESYKGNFSSPLQVMWYVPKNNEILKSHITDSEIRRWIKNAATYHGIPHVLLSVILQQENGPNATTFQKLGQFAERTITTFSAIVDEHLGDIVPDSIAGSSSGFANMSRSTLRSAAKYTEEKYGKNPLPNSVRYRLLGWDQDTRIPGDDWKSDLYYCAAHLRQLIDRVTGRICHNGSLTLQQLKKVIYSYNGSGPLAEKYASDAMKTLADAARGKAKLYFYEK